MKNKMYGRKTMRNSTLAKGGLHVVYKANVSRFDLSYRDSCQGVRSKIAAHGINAATKIT